MALKIFQLYCSLYRQGHNECCLAGAKQETGNDDTSISNDLFSTADSTDNPRYRLEHAVYPVK